MGTAKDWIDVSHIISWKGILSGIERVEYHLIKHYFENTDAGFISWDKGAGHFYELGRDEIKRKIVDKTSEQELLHEDKAPLSEPIFKRMLQKVSISQKQNGKVWEREGKIIVLAGLWDDQGYIDTLVRLSDANPLIHVVYDMIPIVQPGFVVDYLPEVFSNYMLAILPKCKGILAISNATKQDVERVLRSYKLNVPKVIAFRLGDDITRAGESLKPKDTPVSFILSVSTIEARKNHQLLYYAYKLAVEKGVELPPLVIAGRRGWLTGDFQYVVEHDPDVKDKIKIIDKVSDSEMHWLYENCLFTVFPSFYEGWGLPVAESLGYGKVTLASNKSSIPEVGGANVDYFSPYSADELLALILNYKDKVNRSNKEKTITSSYKPFVWGIASAAFASEVNDLTLIEQ